MMLRYLLTLFLLLQLSHSFGQRFNETYGQPIVVLIETDPWLMVIGSDVPAFALYENGQIIYRKVVNRRYQYFQVQHDREETQRIIRSFGITDSLMQLPRYTEASYSTDQPTNLLLLHFDTVRQIAVYGNLRSPGSAARAQTPGVFLRVYDNILKYDDAAATEWLPDSVEVLATKYSYSPEKPLAWNPEWGGISSASTVKRGDDLYSIYIDKKYFEDFQRLLKKMKQKQAVEIEGEKYSLTFRLPFPNLR